MSEIDKIYAKAMPEAGYLEKATNAYLDDKTLNAGYRNYTKYWRDIRKRGRMSAYGYSTTSDFAGGPSWPYCAGGIDDTFCRALGEARTEELLLHGSAAFINCETMYEKARAAGRIYAAPKVGDIVLFYNGSGIHYHTEWCYKTGNGIMYTIGWNTSGASAVIANGGGVCAKRYVVSSLKAHYYRPAYKSTESSIFEDTGTSVTQLKYGTQGAAVEALQQMLIYLGYDCGSSGADGFFGNATLSAVKKFQKDRDLSIDGIYGPNMAKRLNTAYNAKKNGMTTDPDKAVRLFVGKIKNNGVDVRTWAGREYGNIQLWPKLGKGNLVDVLDYNQKATDGELWRYVLIANKYHGFVQDKNIERK